MLGLSMTSPPLPDLCVVITTWLWPGHPVSIKALTTLCPSLQLFYINDLSIPLNDRERAGNFADRTGADRSFLHQNDLSKEGSFWKEIYYNSVNSVTKDTQGWKTVNSKLLMKTFKTHCQSFQGYSANRCRCVHDKGSKLHNKEQLLTRK